MQNLSGTPECASSLWRRWKVRISASGGPLDIVFPKLPKTSSLSWNSVRCVVEGKGGYLKGNSLTVSEASLSVSKLKLVGGNNEWEGNIMVEGKPVCDDGAKKLGKAAAQVVCRFTFFWSIFSQKFTITIIFLDAVACQMSTMSKCPNVRCKKICPDSRSVEICLMMSIKLS